MEQQPFYIGQKVVCLITDEIAKRCRKGKVYTVLSINKTNCGCAWVIDIGAKVSTNNWHCGICERHLGLSNGIGYLDAKYFAPITDQYADMTHEIAQTLTETRETPDRVIIKEPVNN